MLHDGGSPDAYKRGKHDAIDKIYQMMNRRCDEYLQAKRYDDVILIERMMSDVLDMKHADKR